MNTIEKTKTILPLYLPALLIPIAITGGLLLLYSSGIGNMYPLTLSLYNVLLSGIASFCFMIYLKKSEQHPNLTGTWCILMSISYGLCSHALLPTAEHSAQIIFAILPLLILSFETFVLSQKTIYFIIMLSACLFINPITTSAIMIGLTFAFFFTTNKKSGALIADFGHLLSLYVLSVCISGAVSLPAYKEQFEIAATQSYSGFSLVHPFSNLISRFLPGAIPSFYYSNARNVCLYFGLFFFLMFVLYFFHNAICRKKRLKTLCFVGIILCAIEFSPVRFIFELFAENTSSFMYFECLFIFWCLKCAAKTLPILSQMKPLNIICGLLCGLLILAYGLTGSYLNFHSTALNTIIPFIILYIVCILFSWRRMREDFIKLLLCIFIVMELFCNSLLITNYNLFSSNATYADHFIWTPLLERNAEEESNTVADTNTSVSSDSQKLQADYQSFLDEHYDQAFMDLLLKLISEVELTDADREAYNQYGLLNPIEQANAACRKLGASGDLLIPANLQFAFPSSEYYKVTEQGGGVYNLHQYENVQGLPSVYTAYSFTPDRDGTFVLYNNIDSLAYTFESCQTGNVENGLFRAPVATTISLNIYLKGYYLDLDVYDEVTELITTHQETYAASDISMGIYYFGIAMTCIGILIFLALYFNRDKEPLLRPLYNIKQKLSRLPLWKTLGKHLTNNYVYYLAFIIPALLYIVTMIVYSCIPFGNNSFYDEDGIASSLPSIMSAYYNIKDGNTSFSMLGGYGYSPYMTNATFIFRAVLTLLPAGQIPALILFLEALAYGLSSLSVVYYLTHRLSGIKAHKKDYRTLVPAFIYTLSTFMLATHCFPTWYYVFFTLPLLLLAMDYLMHQKTWGLYVLTLGFCIFTNTHLSIFVCFFLIIWFFTYRFESIKDFVFKGFRFGLCSLMAAGCNFFKLSDTFASKSASHYQEADSVLPAFGWHTSFFEQWKQLFIFSPSSAVSRDNGYINLYMGILTLILLGLYIASKRIPLRQKLSRLIPVIILTLSFNEKVLSYIWNGFHYQSNVPNRYVFLLLFLCATIAYDAVIQLKHTSFLKHSIICVLLGIFLILCHIYGENTTKAFVYSLILIAIYAAIQLLYKKVHRIKMPYYKIITTILLLELSANMFFTTSNYALTQYIFINDFEQTSEFVNTKLDAGTTPGRIATPSMLQLNSGMIYNMPCGSFFNSYVSASQSKLHSDYGFLSGNNFTTYNYNSTPLGLSLSGHKYILLPLSAGTAVSDTVQYDYIGQHGNHYIYENPDALSLGIYVPENILHMSENIAFTPVFQNELVSFYTSADEPLYTIHPLVYAQDITQTPNSYSYCDRNGNPLSLEDVTKFLEGNSLSGIFASRDLNMDIHLLPVADGMTYLYHNEFVPLGYGNTGIPLITDSMFPNHLASADTNYFWVTFSQSVFEEFINVVSQNQMEDVIIDDNHIYGTTRYENEGYTMLSLPYDTGWHAYIDGEEVPLESPYGSFMIFKTPAGEHQIELIYERTGMKTGIYFSIGCAFFVLLLYALWRYTYKKKNGFI